MDKNMRAYASRMFLHHTGEKSIETADRIAVPREKAIFLIGGADPYEQIEINLEMALTQPEQFASMMIHTNWEVVSTFGPFAETYIPGIFESQMNYTDPEELEI